ncbi:hypothetical protein EJB05_13398 [Eragrostis curvula]|uniref:Tubby C-terminal domain-containing protein n=1 Tax=Eragrostis curvula TaxID=38414 RepID=A0A5J9VX91_9POAL|nr:hypothetical protein EJB05_13398 [Eragrostis curvula]
MAAPPPMLPALPAPAPTGGQLEPLPVVAPHYCVPYVVALNVKQDMSFAEGNFTITDANDAVVLRVKSPVFTIHNRRFLRDAADQPLLCMREKVFSLHNRWEVFRGDSYNDGDLLFTAKTTSVLQLFKTEMDIFLASNTAMEVCDFKMKGSFKERSCVFYLGNTNTMIAQMHRLHSVGSTVLGLDKFGITVFPNVDYVFIAALVVMLQEIHTDKND